MGNLHKTLDIGRDNVPQPDRTFKGKFGFDEMDIGMDLSSPVSPDYKPPFKFTGTIEKVTIDIKK